MMASSTTVNMEDVLLTVPMTTADLHQFHSLWKGHLVKLGQGKIAYYLPKNMGDTIGRFGLYKRAKNLRLVTNMLSYDHS